MKQESIEKHIEDLYSVRKGLIHKSEKLSNLKSKLHVDYTGDLLQGGFIMKLSHGAPKPSDIQNTILNEFIDTYGLQLEDDVKNLDKCIDFMEAISRKAYYCEVDLLFDEKKEPVEC